jgi:hypothetical protein
MFDLAGGGLVCENCLSPPSASVNDPCRSWDAVEWNGNRRIYLSKGTIKQLLWAGNTELEKSGRIHFSSQSLREGLGFLESFVPYYLGKSPRSLGFLRQIRQG